MKDHGSDSAEGGRMVAVDGCEVATRRNERRGVRGRPRPPPPPARRPRPPPPPPPSIDQ